ncbi:CPBP family intramembrane glutamic endopeptidase [Desulfoluna butyratoxydans]|nr:CPBP family intramembrane glutamic endopeptidase [Desulfoluna butyratoxydans]
MTRSLVAASLVLLLEAAGQSLAPMAPPLALILVLRIVQGTIMVLLLRDRFVRGDLGRLSFEALTQATKRGVVWCLGFGAVVGAVALVLAVAGINPLHLIRMHLPQDPSTLALFFVTGCLVAPLAEELFFRGIVYRLLRPMGVIPAVLISTLVFAAAHAMHGVVPVTQLAGGLLFAVAYEKEGHLAVPVIIHGAGNTALFTLSLI